MIVEGNAQAGVQEVASLLDSSAHEGSAYICYELPQEEHGLEELAVGLWESCREMVSSRRDLVFAVLVRAAPDTMALTVPQVDDRLRVADYGMDVSKLYAFRLSDSGLVPWGDSCTRTIHRKIMGRELVTTAIITHRHAPPFFPECDFVTDIFIEVLPLRDEHPAFSDPRGSF